jgi:uncharacterized protein YukE
VGKTVVVHAEEIRALAKKFLDWSTDIDGFLQKAGHLEIRPGYLTEGGDLKARFNIRAGELKTSLTNLQTALYKIGVELNHIADVYDQTHDLQKDDIDRLNDLVNSVSGTFPGVKDVMPKTLTP